MSLVEFRRGAVLSPVCLLLSAGSVFAGTITLSVPSDTVVRPGTTLVLPVRTTPVGASDSVIGFNFGVRFPTSVLKLDPSRITTHNDQGRTWYSYEGVVGSPMLNGWMFQNSLADNTIRLVGSRAFPLVGSGTMFTIAFLVRDDAPDLAVGDVEIVRLEGKAYLNEGTPPSVAENGVVRVRVVAYPPVANAGGPYTGKINVPIAFNGSGSDPDGSVVKYEWDFDGDGTWDYASATTGVASHTYLTGPTRTYAAKLRVTDNDGNVTEQTVQVTVTDYSPVANPGGPYTGKINVPVTFSGSGSDPDGSVVKYEWDFDGDGTYDWTSPTTGASTHTYTTAQTYTAGFRVTDDDGNGDVRSVQVVITLGQSPVASAGGPYTGKVNVPITFNGSGSDPDGSVVKYEWDFDGDGTYDATSTTTGQATYTYSTNPTRTYSAKLRVTDDDGNADIEAVQVTVTNYAPTANPGGPYTGKTNDPIAFSGSGSDPDGQIIRYEWDFEGDGTYDWTSTTTATTTHTYTVAAAWTYSAALRVTDDDGNADVKSVQVAITFGQSPIASAGGPYTGKVNVPIAFNGSASDPDGRIVKYEWDFDGDGTWDYTSTTTGVASHTYPTGPTRTYGAKLRVTDDDGNVTEKAVQVTVTNYLPVADPGGPYTGKVNVPVAFSGSGSDPDGQIVKYEWDFDGDETYDSTSTTTGATTHTYTLAVARTYSAALRVTDDDGNADVKSVQVAITLGQSPIAVVEDRPRPHLPEISAWPNPFNPRVTLRVNLRDDGAGASGPLEGMIVNAAGHIVRRWTMQRGTSPPGEGPSWVWDGTDDSGRPVASGVYLVVVARAGQRYRTAITLLR